MTGRSGFRRAPAALVVALVTLVVGTLAGSDAAAPPPSPVPAIVTTSPPASPVAGRPIGGLAIPPEAEPYDYRPAPPRATTPIDGFYLRIFTLEEMGGPKLGIPVHCLRCVPYSVDAGVQTLLLHEGRFWLEHQLNGFRALGHFTVDGDRIALFNDVNCSLVRGRYTWHLEGGALTFEVIDDPCPYVNERSNDLTLEPWTRVDVCVSGIEDWYPVRVGCRG